jgi:hypothetical protein
MTESQLTTAARSALTPNPSPKGRGGLKRRLLKLGLWLLLGAIINVAVAWGCAAFGRTARWPTPKQESTPFLVEWRGLGLQRKSSTTYNDDSGRWETVCLHKAGWPMLSLMRTNVITNVGAQPSLAAVFPQHEQRLYAPIFPGFAINTVFYAAVLWVVFASPGKLRRRIRRRRGLCVRCGYDLRGSASSASTICPECGTAFPSPSGRG